MTNQKLHSILKFTTFSFTDFGLYPFVEDSRSNRYALFNVHQDYNSLLGLNLT